MPSIDIRHSHSQGHDEARAAVEHVAARLQERFDIGCAWQGDTLEFSRPGVNGAIRVGDDEIHVVMNLGFLLSALRLPIQHEIERYLTEEFG